MNDMRKGWSGMAAAARVVAVAMVLACLAPQRMEARAPVLDAAGGGSALPAGLSAGDWAAIQARLAQAGTHAPLVTGEVAKLTAADAAAYDYFGSSVAVSGDTVVVGVRDDDDACPADPDCDSGSAHVFERNRGGADHWEQVAKLTADDAAAGDEFGYAVAISGDTVVVGAYVDDDGGDDSGSAYVFERNWGGADHWGQVRKLTASDAAAGDEFGYAVALSGDTVVVGAHYDSDGGNLSGSAYVYERNQGGPDKWGEVEKLTAGDAAAYDGFGGSVAISGDTVVVGAYADDDGGATSGSAYVFGRNWGGADSWGQVRKLTASDAAAGDRFGNAVAISGDTVVVGAVGDDTHTGSAYVFERNQDGEDKWGEVEKLTASDAAEEDDFGYAVAISGDTVIIGAWGDDDRTGSVYLFERNRGGADSWGQVAKLTAGDAVPWDDFGRSVAISGDTVVVGARADDDVGENSGSAYVFARQGAAWPQQRKPTAYDTTPGDLFGESVAVSGDVFTVGAPGNGESGSAYLFYRNQDGADQWGQVEEKYFFSLPIGADLGKSVAIDVDTAAIGAPGVDRAYVFERNDDGADLWGHVGTLAGAGGSDFGNSVSISGDTVVVGAPRDDVACGGCGAAYVFERNQGGADTWGLRAVLTAGDPAGGDEFGWSVAISGDTVVVGARLDTHGGKSQAGSVYVFKRNQDGADKWGEVENLTADDAAAHDRFGHAVAISGDTFVVGAPVDDGSTGSVYVFERNHDGADGWGQVEKLTADDGAIGDCFGWSVGINDDTVVVGAPYDDDGGNGSGSAYLFKRNGGGADHWGQVEKLTAGDAAQGDYFGRSVAISGNTVVVGAPYDDDEGNDAGSTYVFRWAAAEVYLPLVLSE
jgi:hypothetical protein